MIMSCVGASTNEPGAVAIEIGGDDDPDAVEP
jgi:hypothetical protein